MRTWSGFGCGLSQVHPDRYGLQLSGWVAVIVWARPLGWGTERPGRTGFHRLHLEIEAAGALRYSVTVGEGEPR